MEDDQLGEEDFVFSDDKWVSSLRVFYVGLYSSQHAKVSPESQTHRKNTLVTDKTHHFKNTKIHQKTLNVMMFQLFADIKCRNR